MQAQRYKSCEDSSFQNKLTKQLTHIRTSFFFCLTLTVSVVLSSAQTCVLLSSGMLRGQPVLPFNRNQPRALVSSRRRSHPVEARTYLVDWKSQQLPSCCWNGRLPHSRATWFLNCDNASTNQIKPRLTVFPFTSTTHSNTIIPADVVSCPLFLGRFVFAGPRLKAIKSTRTTSTSRTCAPAFLCTTKLPASWRT